jgi:hypothetical protein
MISTLALTCTGHRCTASYRASRTAISPNPSSWHGWTRSSASCPPRSRPRPARTRTAPSTGSGSSRRAMAPTAADGRLGRQRRRTRSRCEGGRTWPGGCSSAASRGAQGLGRGGAEEEEAQFCGVEGTPFDSDTPVAYVDQLASEIKNKIITTHNRNLPV